MSRITPSCLKSQGPGPPPDPSSKRSNSPPPSRQLLRIRQLDARHSATRCRTRSENQDQRAVVLELHRVHDSELVAEVETLLAGADREGILDSDIAALDDFQPSAIIAGRFRIASLLGRGGMGNVYEAEDLQLGERVALKTIRPEMASNPVLIERFKKEIQLAKRITHPNVCRMHDVGFHPSSTDPDARLFLTMELVPGETLARRLSSGPMISDQAFPIIAQLAEGLDAAHQAGVIHRDFKTNNVMVADGHGKPRAVITDFGLARAF